MTGVDKIAEIRKSRFLKGLPIREITRAIKLSRPTVQKILRTGLTKFSYKPRENQPHPVTERVKVLIDCWVREDQGLKRKQRRSAQRIYDILSAEHGYEGSYESIAKCVRDAKQELMLTNKEAYIPLIYYAGDAFQFDWGEMPVYIGGKKETVYFAVIQLCHSRYFYVRAYCCQKQELMLDAHRRAFEHFGGACKRGIYDNLKSAVKHLLKGHHRNLQEKFVRFCSHYLYEPEFCNPASGNEKGRVESTIGVIERNFFVPIQHFQTLEELNNRLMNFAITYSKDMKHPEIAGKSRYEVFEEERKVLVQLHPFGFDCCRENTAVVSPCCLVYYDNNRYSVPSEYVGRMVSVKGYADEVVMSYRGTEITKWKRLFVKNEYSLDPLHYLKILETKPGAFKDGMPFKGWKLPEVFNRYREILRDRYDDGDKYFVKILTLLLSYPEEEVAKALEEAIKLGVYGDDGVLSILRHEKEPPEVEHLDILIKVELSRYSARQRPLSDYDELLRRRNMNIIEKGGDIECQKQEEKR